MKRCEIKKYFMYALIKVYFKFFIQKIFGSLPVNWNESSDALRFIHFFPSHENQWAKNAMDTVETKNGDR